MATSLPSVCTVSSRVHRVLVRAAITWAVFLTVLWMLAPKYACDGRSRGYVTATKSDLRNLAKAQEAYHARHGRYASTISDLDSLFHKTTGPELAIEHASADRWHARGTHPLKPRLTCRVDQSMDHPRCETAQTWSERHLPKPSFGNVVIDYWLIALTLWRRQRRLQQA